jgi:hypothetical protein
VFDRLVLGNRETKARILAVAPKPINPPFEGGTSIDANQLERGFDVRVLGSERLHFKLPTVPCGD